MAEQENSTGKGKVVDFDGADPKKPAAKRSSTGAIPVTSSSSANPVATGAPAGIPKTTQPGTTAPGAPAPGTSGAREQTAFQKSQLKSAFQQAADAATKREHSIGNTRAPLFEDEDDEPTALGARYDGETPAPELTRKDLWKAVQAPIQSREGRRSAELLRMVINQFAVGHNPRYEPDEPTKPRGHIFVWDVSRAMNCEIPHFVGARELSLSQTVDWLRHEGPMRGWTRINVDGAQAAALEGKLVVAIPKDIKLKQMAVVLPEEETSSDGKPYVAAAGKNRGNKLKLGDALGVFVAEMFVHT